MTIPVSIKQCLEQFLDQKHSVSEDKLSDFKDSAASQIDLTTPKELSNFYNSLRMLELKGKEKKKVNKVSRLLLEYAGFDDSRYGFDLRYVENLLLLIDVAMNINFGWKLNVVISLLHRWRLLFFSNEMINVRWSCSGMR